MPSVDETRAEHPSSSPTRPAMATSVAKPLPLTAKSSQRVLMAYLDMWQASAHQAVAAPTMSSTTSSSSSVSATTAATTASLASTTAVKTDAEESEVEEGEIKGEDVHGPRDEVVKPVGVHDLLRHFRPHRTRAFREDEAIFHGHQRLLEVFLKRDEAEPVGETILFAEMGGYTSASLAKRDRAETAGAIERAGPDCWSLAPRFRLPTRLTEDVNAFDALRALLIAAGVQSRHGFESKEMAAVLGVHRVTALMLRSGARTWSAYLRLARKADVVRKAGGYWSLAQI